MLRDAIVGMSIVLMLAVCCRAEDKAAVPLTIQSELHILQGKDKDGQPKVVRLPMVQLINSSDKPITVLTERLEQSYDEQDGVTTITLGLELNMTKDGRRIIPSLSSYAPVTLLPGEAAVIPPDRIDLFEYKTGKLRIGYRVSEFWGKRFSLWFGKIVSDTVMK